jgi:hypothetical protein
MKKLILASLAVSLLSTSALAQEMRAIRSITVSGMAERKVVPDEAHITVNLNAQDKDMAKARAAHQQKLAKLMAIVKKNGIDERKVSTQSANIQPIYTYRNDSNGHSQRVFEGYRVQTQLDVTVGDTAKLGTLMDEISSAGFEQGANTEWGNLISIYYTLSKPDQLRDEMLVQAIANAKAKAERMADAAGAGLGKVYSINENGTPQFQPVMVAAAPRAMMMKAEAAMDAAPPAGEQNVQSNVTVTYELQ